MKIAEEMKGVGVVAFAFGTPSSIGSNRRIATIALLNRELGVDNKGELKYAPLYTQRDIEVFGGGEAYTKTAYEEETGNLPSTLRIARGAVKWAKQNGLSKILVAAAGPHLWRCIRDLKYAICEADAYIKVCVCRDEVYPRSAWFDPYSTQERVRSFWKWWPREIILRLMPMAIYKRIAI